MQGFSNVRATGGVLLHRKCRPGHDGQKATNQGLKSMSLWETGASTSHERTGWLGGLAATKESFFFRGGGHSWAQKNYATRVTQGPAPIFQKAREGPDWGDDCLRIK